MESCVDFPLRPAAVVAMGRDGAIGFNGDMPWHLPEDLKYFKQLTMHHPVIMGRRTWLSIPRRPLPGRRNLVLSRDSAVRAELAESGAEPFESLSDALTACAGQMLTPFIIGGGTVYREAMPSLAHLYVTRIDAVFPDADTFFPEIDESDWTLAECSEPALSKTGLTYRFEHWIRTSSR